MKEGNQLYIYAEEDVTKALWKLSIPAMFSQLIQIVYNMINSFYIARLNDVAMLAAITVSMTVESIPFAFSSAIGIGASSYLARQLGQGESSAQETVKTTMTMCLIVYLGALLVCFTILRPVLNYLTNDTSVVQYAVVYSSISLVGVLPSMLKQICINLLRTEGDVVFPTVAFLISAVLNVLLAPFLMFEFGLNLGVAGAALATVISTLVTAIFLMYRLCFKTQYVRWNLFEFGIKKEAAKEIIKVGSAVFLRDFLPGLANATFAKAAGFFGTAFVAGAGVGKKASRIAITMIQGATKGFLPFAAYNYGAKNYKRLKEGIVKIVFSMTIIAGVASIAFLIIPEVICNIYVSDKEAMVYAVETVRFSTISLIAMGVYNTLLSVLQGMGRNRDSMIVSIARGVIYYIPIVYYLPKVIGVMGIYISQPLTDWLTILTILLISRKSLLEIFGENSEKNN